MGAKGKYNEQIVESILDAIAVTGSDAVGYQKGGISHDTFYSWIKRYPEFAEGVTRAKEEFRKSCGDGPIRLANKALDDYLNGRVIETWECEEDAVNPRTGGIERLHSIKRVNRGVPKWAIERVLGKPVNDIAQLREIADKLGFILVPKDGALFEEFLPSSDGSVEEGPEDGSSYSERFDEEEIEEDDR